MKNPRHRFPRRFLALLALVAWALPVGAAEPTVPAAPETAPPGTLDCFVAIDNVCAWPNLTVLRDGTIVATIFGQPSHGQVAGAAECWASSDGRFWEKRGVPAPNDPLTNRMNVGAGLAKNGDLIVLISGWTDVKQPQRPKAPIFRDAVLPAWVCRSSDGGRTWTQRKEFPTAETGFTDYVPFGDILAGEDGALHTSAYAGEYIDPTVSGMKFKSFRSWHFRSDDDGRTWRRTSVIGPKNDETTILHLGGKRWLAAARHGAVELFRSDDDGETWQGPQRVTEPKELNGHLLRLKDGRLLLSYGNRIKDKYGVLAKLSSDEGKTWSAPIRLAHTTTWDCGYPSSIQRPDGKIVTAYYSASVENHTRYHMGVAIWAAPATTNP